MEEAVRFYQYLVDQRVPGPRSISYLVPFVLLPSALMISPRKISHGVLASLFVPPIVACIVHAWIAMGTVDVISVDVLLWSCHLIWWEDVRRDYSRVRWRRGTPGVRQANLVSRSTLERAQDLTLDKIESEEVAASRSFQYASGKQARDDEPVKSINGTLCKRREVETCEQRYPEELLTRLQWVGNLIASTRMNGWKIGSLHHDARVARCSAPLTRLSFVLSITPYLIIQFCLLSITTLLAHYDPYFNNAGTINITSPYQPTHPSYGKRPPIITALQIIPPPILRPFVLGVTAYCMISIQYNLPSPLAVLSNHLFGIPSDEWSPHTVEPYFGSFTGVLDSGVRGLWGTWWHQHMRVFSSAPGVALARALGLRSRNGGATTGAFILQLVSAFFFSGVAHMGLVPPHPRYASTASPWQLRLRIAAFFWVQPLAIGVEIFAGRVLGGSRSRKGHARVMCERIARLVWVLSWLILTLPLLGVPFAELGYWRLLSPGVPFHWLWVH